MQVINLGKGSGKKTEKRNSEVSSCSLLCGVLNCPQCRQCGLSVTADGWNTLSKLLICTIMWFHKLHWKCAWGKKIDKWVHRKWHLFVDWVWGFDIKLYCINEVFWWQSEQSYVMRCKPYTLHCWWQDLKSKKGADFNNSQSPDHFRSLWSSVKCPI